MMLAALKEIHNYIMEKKERATKSEGIMINCPNDGKLKLAITHCRTCENLFQYEFTKHSVEIECRSNKQGDDRERSNHVVGVPAENI